jgi:polysaccharide export outer membrane protein
MEKVVVLTVFCLAVVALIFQVNGFPAQTTPPLAAAQSPAAASPDVSKDYIIGLEDVLSINIWKEPELSVREVVVRPDGKISLPLVSDIQASGLTTVQLQEKIAEKLKEFVASPVVSVIVVKVMSRSVSIVGEVLRAGSYPLVSPMTVLELLARAGGVTLDAKTKKIKIIRKEDGKTIQISFNYSDIKNGKNLESNISLKDRDVVVVP